MIRRGFWLAAGAVLGITGYRSAARLGRALTGQDQLVLVRQDQQLLTPRSRRPVARRDVPALAAGEEAPPGEQSAVRPRSKPATTATRSAIALAVATAGFIRDVRQGMAEYGDLHHGEPARTLGSRSAQALPGESRQGRREP
jgi:hypothetical protein